MTTIEKNKVIAAFMGGLYQKDVSFSMQSNYVWLPEHGVCRFDTVSNGKHLNYHRSWDWLMPVIQKLFQADPIFQNNIDACKMALQYRTVEELYEIVYHWITKINEANNA